MVANSLNKISRSKRFGRPPKQRQYINCSNCYEGISVWHIEQLKGFITTVQKQHGWSAHFGRYGFLRWFCDVPPCQA